MARGQRKVTDEARLVGLQPRVDTGGTWSDGEWRAINALKAAIHAAADAESILEIVLPVDELVTVAAKLNLELEEVELAGIHERARRAVSRLPNLEPAELLRQGRAAARGVAAHELAARAALGGVERARALSGFRFAKRDLLMLESPALWEGLLAENWSLLPLYNGSSFHAFFYRALPPHHSLLGRLADALGGSPGFEGLDEGCKDALIVVNTTTAACAPR